MNISKGQKRIICLAVYIVLITCVIQWSQHFPIFDMIICIASIIFLIGFYVFVIVKYLLKKSLSSGEIRLLWILPLFALLNIVFRLIFRG